MSITETFRTLPHRLALVGGSSARRRWLARTEPLRQPADARYERGAEQRAEQRAKQRAELRAELRDGALLTLIESLPPGLRDVLVLRELEGFDDATAGRILGLEAMTVRVRLRAAHVALERRILRHLGAGTK